MEQSDLLRVVVTGVEGLGLRYLVTGSVATIFYGEPRFTNDIDIVIDIPMERVREFCELFPAPEFYVDEESAREAIRRRRQFNIIHPSSGLKVDVIIPRGSDFDRSRFARRKRVHPGGEFEASFAAPEDVIIMKMVYHREGGSEKHLRDITGILRTSGTSIDEGYITEWVEQLGLQDIWASIVRRLEK
jgi:hypothetical protein